MEVGDFGYELEKATVEGVRDVVLNLCEMPQSEMKRRILDTYLESSRYSMDGFKDRMLRAIFRTLSMKGLV